MVVEEEPAFGPHLKSAIYQVSAESDPVTPRLLCRYEETGVEVRGKNCSGSEKELCNEKSNMLEIVEVHLSSDRGRNK